VDNETIEEELKSNFTVIRKTASDKIKEIKDEYDIIINKPKKYLKNIAIKYEEELKKTDKEEVKKKLKDDYEKKVSLMNKYIEGDYDENNFNIESVEKVKRLEEECEKNIKKETLLHFNYSKGQYVRYGILPEILSELLNARTMTKNRMKTEKDEFVKKVLDSLQNAYKVTANSLYGQTGAKTSPIYFLPIAACTTAIGRQRLYFAKKIVEEKFPGSQIIYGDTDSIFINFHIKDENGNDRVDREALIKSIELGKKAATVINDNVPKPQAIVYEKTFHPFILVAKKKYVGLLYEENPDESSLKSMGIVLKRRDNAPIVKIVVGGIINSIIETKNADLAISYTKDVLNKLMIGKYAIDKFIISKALKAKYKNPKSIPHKVLADRMGERDPGNKPQINDRIPFVYVVKKLPKKQKKVLQGELVEHPEYVNKNSLKIDYMYYLEHQIIKPASQILELLMTPGQVHKLFNSFIINEKNFRLNMKTFDNLNDHMISDDDDWEPVLK
jgi:DNA polymerase elongation subunit (family B)